MYITHKNVRRAHGAYFTAKKGTGKFNLKTN